MTKDKILYILIILNIITLFYYISLKNNIVIKEKRKTQCMNINCNNNI